MAFLRAFGRYLPERILDNQELAALNGADPAWILQACGIEQRRIAAEPETVTDLAFRAAGDCLAKAGVAASSLGLILVASGTAERRFPGPAASVAARLGLSSTPALDIPIASAGGLFGLALAAQLAPAYGEVLVVAAEKMSAAVLQPPVSRETGILFGDGAGACLVSRDAGVAEVLASALGTDGSYADALQLPLAGPLQMDGRTVILQAGRKIPQAIEDALAKAGVAAADVQVFLLHQANLNLLVRVARALKVEESRVFTNLQQYGNTSSASMLIAASEWFDTNTPEPGKAIVFGAFGAGFHWGALVARAR